VATRRQLTVLSCILVGASRLVRQLDPEDLHVVMQGLHTLGTEVVQRLEGFIAQYLWDGILVYFGYPQAQENDAERAVRAGLELVAGLPNPQRRPVAVRRGAGRRPDWDAYGPGDHWRDGR